MHREHPIKILRYTAKNLWLLIFPLLRGAHFLPFSAQAAAEWIRGAWFDLLIGLLILAYGAIRWYVCSFTYNTDVICHQTGVLWKKETEIPCRSITAVTEERAFYLRPFGAVRLRIHTGAKDIAGADMQLLLHQTDLMAIRAVIPILQEIPNPTERHRPHIARLLLFSFLFSSSLSGAIYAAAIFFQGGKITRDIFAELQAEALLMTLTEQAASYFRGIPKAALTVSILILSAWLLSFAGNLLRYSRFRFHAGVSVFSVHRGLLTKQRYHLRRGAVNYIDIRQNLMMKLFRLISIHISCPGYGNQKNELPVLLPLLKKKQASALLCPLLPKPCQIPFSSNIAPKPKQSAFRIWLFVWQPMTCISVICALILFMAYAFPAAYNRFSFFGFMLLLPFAWLLLIRLISAAQTRMWIEEDQICLHYSKAFLFHTLVAPVQHLVSVRITRTRRGRKRGICNVFFYFQGKRVHRHKLTGMPEETVQQMLQRCGFRCEQHETQ